MLSYDMEARGQLSLYEHLYRCIKQDIEHGKLVADDKLPSKRLLASHLGISTITVQNAYAQLIAEGYVRAKTRRGYYVATLPEGAAHRHASLPVRHIDDHEVSNLPREKTVQNAINHSAAALWSKALRNALVQESRETLFSEQPAQGCLRLREAIARYLESSRGMSVDPSCIVIGAGAQVLYSMVALMAGREAAIAIEDPGYPRLKSIYLAHNLQVLPLPLDDEGLLVSKLKDAECTIAHVMPSHQFPTGVVMSVARRYELLSWASRSDDRLIIEDDYDWEFRMAGRPIPSLASIDSQGSVVYISTFSKSLSTALRIAFAVLPPRLLKDFDERFGPYTNTVSTIDQIVLARLIESGEYERHVNRFKKQSRDLRDRFISRLESSSLSHAISFEQANSGLHLILTIATNTTEAAIRAAAKNAGIVLRFLSDYQFDSKNMQIDNNVIKLVIPYDTFDETSADKLVKLFEKSVKPS